MPASQIPNLLSLSRLLAAPLLLPAGFLGRAPFVMLLGLLLMTDGLDGYLARRLGALTPRGASLDSAADHLMSICAFASVWRLWPVPLRQEGPYVVVIASAYVLPVVYSLARKGRLFAYHTRLSRLAGAVTAVSLVPFLAGWTSVPFRVAAAIELLVALEYLSISILLPDHRAPIRSIAEARRIAGAANRGVDPAENPS